MLAGATTPDYHSAVSRLVGIVKRLEEGVLAADDARMFFVSSELCGSIGGVAHRLPQWADGADFSKEGAVAAAIGEALERYCAGRPVCEVMYASAEELGAEAMWPTKWSLFHPRQYAQEGFGYVPFTADLRVGWVRARDLARGGETWVPAQLVFLVDVRAGSEPRIGYATSSGLACGRTQDQATLKGLLEVVERDAFMLTWYAQLRRPLVELGSDAVLAERERRHFAPTRLRYRLVDLSVFAAVPTALAVIQGGSWDPIAMAVGAASAVTGREACDKALREAFQTRRWIRHQRADGYRPVRSASEVATFEDHVLFYSDERNARRADFLAECEDTRTVGDMGRLDGRDASEVVRSLAGRLAKQGIEICAVDLSLPDVRDAGFSVVKVISPQLCSLSVGYRQQLRGGTRLYEAPWRLGLRAEPLTYDELNVDPHPFP
jgi:ribosomal protein S12 methylthiotransferase accessory factor